MQRQKRKLLYYGILLALVMGILLTGAFVTKRIESRPIRQLLRPDCGQEMRQETLIVDNGEEQASVTVEVAPRERTQKELEKLFADAREELLEQLKGKNESLSHVTLPLTMPVSAMGDQVSVTWSSDQPEYVSYDGSLGDAIPGEGIRVELEATMMCQQEIRRWTQEVIVWPAAENAGITEALRDMDEDKTGEYYELPSELEGKQLQWYARVNDPAPLAAIAIFLVGILLPFRKAEGEKQEKKRYRERLLQAYPSMVSQLTLYLGAGMSLSQSFSSMAAGKKGQTQDILQKECSLVVGEMARGIPESEAIMHFGDRSELWEYRSFCGLLLQNRKKGNAELLPMLQREAEKAFAERQRRARIMGNEAAARMLLPMTIMLIIVLVIVLFPAIVSFYT